MSKNSSMKKQTALASVDLDFPTFRMNYKNFESKTNQFMQSLQRATAELKNLDPERVGAGF
jgi:hypothetical protein